MAGVRKYCAVVAVTVFAIILPSQEVHAQQWVAHVVTLHAVNATVEDFGKRFNACSNVNEAAEFYQIMIIECEKSPLTSNLLDAETFEREDFLLSLHCMRLSRALLYSNVNALTMSVNLKRQHARAACEQDSQVGHHACMELWKRFYTESHVLVVQLSVYIYCTRASSCVYIRPKFLTIGKDVGNSLTFVSQYRLL